MNTIGLDGLFLFDSDFFEEIAAFLEDNRDKINGIIAEANDHEETRIVKDFVDRVKTILEKDIDKEGLLNKRSILAYHGWEKLKVSCSYLSERFSDNKDFLEIRAKIARTVENTKEMRKITCDQALKLLAEMKAQEIPRNTITYSTLMKKKNIGGKKALELLAEMKEEGILPDTITYSTLMERKDIKGEKALELLAEMKEEEIPPDIITYNTLMKKKNIGGKKALELLAEMKEEGILPGTSTYSRLMERKDIGGEKALELLAEMKDEEIPRNIITYNTLMKKKDIEGEKALGLLDEMKAEGILPGTSTYSRLMERKDIGGEKALELLDEMKAKGIPRNTITYNTLMAKENLDLKRLATFLLSSKENPADVFDSTSTDHLESNKQLSEEEKAARLEFVHGCIANWDDTLMRYHGKSKQCETPVAQREVVNKKPAGDSSVEEPELSKEKKFYDNLKTILKPLSETIAGYNSKVENQVTDLYEKIQAIQGALGQGVDVEKKVLEKISAMMETEETQLKIVGHLKNLKKIPTKGGKAVKGLSKAFDQWSKNV